MAEDDLQERLLDDYDIRDGVRVSFGDGSGRGRLDPFTVAGGRENERLGGFVAPLGEKARPGRRLRTRCGICAPFIVLALVAAALAAAGAILYFNASRQFETFLGFKPGSATLMMGATLLIAFSAAAPMLCLCGCVWINTPSHAAHARAAVFADARLEQVCGDAGSDAALGDAYDIFQNGDNDDDANASAYGASESHSSHSRSPSQRQGSVRDGGATVLMICGGAGAPRVILRGLARRMAASGLRVLVADMPGHGELAAITFSLARCARVISAVLARDARAQGLGVGGAGGVGTAGGAPPLPRVVLIAYGAAAYVAAHFSATQPSALAGLVLLGAPPPTTVCLALRARMLRLLWASDLSNLALRGRVAFASEDEKAELAAAEWNVGAVGDLLADLARARAPFPLLPALRAARAPLMVLGPPLWIARARLLIPLATARFVIGSGIKDMLLPTLVPEKQAVLAAALSKFSRIAVIETAVAFAVAEAARKEAAAAAAAAAVAAPLQPISSSPSSPSSPQLRGGWVATRRTLTAAQLRTGGGGGATALMS